MLVAAQRGGRVRLALAQNNDEATIKRFADRYIAPRADVTTDGHAGYTARAIEQLVAKPARTMNKIIKQPQTYRALQEAAA